MFTQCTWFTTIVFYTLTFILQVRAASEGGTFVLINGTPYTWRLTEFRDNQMNTWSFPRAIYPGSFAKVYVEWDPSVFDDLSGDAIYSVVGPSVYYQFQLQARAPDGNFHLQIYLLGITTVNNPQGSTIDLGWNPNRNTVFALYGSEGGFTSNNPPSAWMHANLATLGYRYMRELCIPGSHDAGMSFLDSKGTAFANEYNTVTQTQSIYQQLVLGSRYFDIRPVKSSGIFKAGHYSDTKVLGWETPVGWQGGNGQKIASIIQDVNSFTATNPELIFLRLSHDLDTDGGYVRLNQGYWNSLLSQLQALNNLFIADPTADFTFYTLNSFISSGRAAVVVLVAPSDEHISLGSFQGQGFYYQNVSFPVVDEYSNKDSVNAMISDQLTKLANNRKNYDSPIFLLSWTLTMSAKIAAAVSAVPPFVPNIPSIIAYARTANNALSTGLLPAVSALVFPNIIYVDNFSNSNITAVALAINGISENWTNDVNREYEQCGGEEFTGLIYCAGGWYCAYINEGYSQCQPVRGDDY